MIQMIEQMINYAWQVLWTGVVGQHLKNGIQIVGQSRSLSVSDLLISQATVTAELLEGLRRVVGTDESDLH